MSVLINIFEDVKDYVSKNRRFRSGASFNIELGKPGKPFEKSLRVICAGLVVFDYGIACADDALTEIMVELASRPDIIGVRRTKGGLDIEVEPVLTSDLPPVDLPPVDLPPVDLPPVDLPPVDLPPVDLPPVDLPPVDLPPVYTEGEGAEDTEDDEDTEDEGTESSLASKLTDGGSPFVNLSTVRTEGGGVVYEDQNYSQAVSRGLTNGLLTRRGSYIFYGERNLGNGVVKAAEAVAQDPELYGILNV